MSATQPGSREVASGFVEALRPALPHGASAVARVAARDVAQMLGLPGLEAALLQLDRHHGPTRPVEVDHLVDRIARLAEQTLKRGDLSAFQEVDRELAAIAAQLDGMEWGAPARESAAAVATWPLGETLSDLRLDAAPDVEHTRLTMSVASALRAAIDWLGAEVSPRVVASVHDSALTLTVSVAHEGGIGPAGAVLAAVEGSLGREPDGHWTIRVPRHSERPSFLLMRQGRFGFALPWHSVARLRMFGPHELDRLAEPRLDVLAALAPTAMQRPAAMVALGLVRGWFIADRIVWRIAAQPEPADTAAPFAGTTSVIEVENGERYWLLEPSWLLRGIAAPDVAPPSPRPHVGSVVLPPAPLAAPGTPPEPASAPEPPAPSSLAEAVERALHLLRDERAAALRAAAVRLAVPPAPAPPAGPAPATESDDLVDERLAFGHEPVPARVPGPMMIEAETDVMRPETPPANVAPPAPPAPPPPTRAPEQAASPMPAAPPAPPAAPPPAPALPRASAAPVAPPPSEPQATPGTGEEMADVPLAHRLAERAPVRRALVADDSLVARIFLARLLEQRGWVVETVSDAAGLMAELASGPWQLVCADYALPDAQGADHVRGLLALVARQDVSARCIVLTRDSDEERIAREAGAEWTLRKPFEADRLDALMRH